MRGFHRSPEQRRGINRPFFERPTGAIDSQFRKKTATEPRSLMGPIAGTSRGPIPSTSGTSRGPIPSTSGTQQRPPRPPKPLKLTIEDPLENAQIAWRSTTGK